MLPNNDIVYNTYTGKNGVMEGAQKDTLFVDSSTISPAVAQKMSKKAEDEGFCFIDAPVSGGNWYHSMFNLKLILIVF